MRRSNICSDRPATFSAWHSYRPASSSEIWSICKRKSSSWVEILKRKVFLLFVDFSLKNFTDRFDLEIFWRFFVQIIVGKGTAWSKQVKTIESPWTAVISLIIWPWLTIDGGTFQRNETRKKNRFSSKRFDSFLTDNIDSNLFFCCTNGIFCLTRVKTGIVQRKSNDLIKSIRSRRKKLTEKTFRFVFFDWQRKKKLTDQKTTRFAVRERRWRDIRTLNDDRRSVLLMAKSKSNRLTERLEENWSNEKKTKKNVDYRADEFDNVVRHVRLRSTRHTWKLFDHRLLTTKCQPLKSDDRNENVDHF